jgi:hypothetical protein
MPLLIVDQPVATPGSLLNQCCRVVCRLSQRWHGNRQVVIDQLETHHRQPAPRIVAGNDAVRHTDPARGAQPTTQRPPHHGLRFSDVGHQMYPTLTARANDTEIDSHHQLAEKIRSDMNFIGAAVLDMWRDRLQFDREHRLDLGRGCQRPLFGPSTIPSLFLMFFQ